MKKMKVAIRNIKVKWLMWAQYLLAIMAGTLVAAAVRSPLIGDLTTLITLIWLFSDGRRQRTEREALEEELQAQALIARRLSARIDAELTKTLATDNYTILTLEQWPARKMAEWPDAPQTAPLMAWDVVVQAHDGSHAPEQLTVYIDASLYTLPAAYGPAEQKGKSKRQQWTYDLARRI
jgi:hypothetical protein